LVSDVIKAAFSCNKELLYFPKLYDFQNLILAYSCARY